MPGIAGWNNRIRTTFFVPLPLQPAISFTVVGILVTVPFPVIRVSFPPGLLHFTFIGLVIRIGLQFFSLPFVFPGLLTGFGPAVFLPFHPWIFGTDALTAGASERDLFHTVTSPMAY